MLVYILFLIIFFFLFFNYFHITEHINYDNLSISAIKSLTSQQIYNIPPSNDLYTYIIPNLSNDQLSSLPSKTLYIIAPYLTQPQIDFLRNFQNFNIPFYYYPYNLHDIAKTLTPSQIKNIPNSVLSQIYPYLSNDQKAYIQKN